MKDKFKDKQWYAYAVAACIAVVLYVALTHLGVIGNAVGRFLGYFSAIILGMVLAYLMNPLAKMYKRRLFGRISKEKLQWTLSVLLAVVTVIIFLIFILGTLIPQLADSVITLVSNMDGYLESLQTLINELGLSKNIDLESLIGSSGSVGSRISSYLLENAHHILNVGATAGKGVARWAIAFILSIYMLMSKDSFKNGALRLMKASMSQKRYERNVRFLGRCDRILVQYVVFSLLDAVIVGVVNALFMKVCGMQYIGLISLLAAVTNLVPTFGPIVGGAIGGFILLLVKPLHALLFIAFTVVLQILDGYIIKPKLFGDSLGVSGLLILAAVIVFGNMFGVMGMLLAIPIAAILDFVYEEELLPYLERRRAAKERQKVSNN